MTPCQKCKAERDRLRGRCVEGAERERVLRAALLEAIARLNDYLQAAEGAPEPSENDTKHLVARLHDALQTTGD